MNSGKRFLRWGILILAALIYLSIAVIPFVNSVKPTDGALAKVGLTVGEIIVLGVMLAILVAVVIVGLKKREKVSSVAREYESEVKRITWFPWKDTRKNTVVVLIAMVICGAVISLLDLALAKGIFAFIDLF